MRSYQLDWEIILQAINRRLGTPEYLDSEPEKQRLIRVRTVLDLVGLPNMPVAYQKKGLSLAGGPVLSFQLQHGWYYGSSSMTFFWYAFAKAVNAAVGEAAATLPTSVEALEPVEPVLKACLTSLGYEGEVIYRDETETIYTDFAEFRIKPNQHIQITTPQGKLGVETFADAVRVGFNAWVGDRIAALKTADVGLLLNLDQRLALLPLNNPYYRLEYMPAPALQCGWYLTVGNRTSGPHQNPRTALEFVADWGYDASTYPALIVLAEKQMEVQDQLNQAVAQIEKSEHLNLRQRSRAILAAEEAIRHSMYLRVSPFVSKVLQKDKGITHYVMVGSDGQEYVAQVKKEGRGGARFTVAVGQILGNHFEAIHVVGRLTSLEWCIFFAVRWMVINKLVDSSLLAAA